MKKLFALVMTVFLLAGCASVPPEETTQPTTEPTTVPTTSPATQPTTAPTTAPPTTEPTEPVLDPALWLTDPQYPSYEAFLQTEPAMLPLGADSWIINEGDTGIVYWLRSLQIISSADSLTYSVPGGKALWGYELLAVDGKHCWLKAPEELLKVELLTGKTVGTLATDQLLAWQLADTFVLYYVEYDGTHFNACRVYLPEMKQDILSSFEAPEKVYIDDGTTYTGSLQWILFNPKLLTLIEKELNNPESAYRTLEVYGEKHDFSNLWNNENFWLPQYLTGQDMFWYGVQEKSGIRAFVRYTYHPEDGTLTTDEGIIDICAFGDGGNHDHFHPEITRIPAPSVVTGSWKETPGQDIQGQLPPKPTGNFSLGKLRFGTDPEKLYSFENGYYKALGDFAVRAVSPQEDGIYATTEDNRILQLAYDGSVCNTLYTGSEPIKSLAVLDGRIYFNEGEYVMELDPAKNQYRVLVKQKYLTHVFYFSEDGKEYIGFAAGAGLAGTQYIYDPKTGAVAAL